MIVLFSFPDDLTLRRVGQHLAARQVELLTLDTQELQRSWRLTVELSASEREQATLRLNGKSVRLSDIHSAWLRRPVSPRAPEQVHDVLLRRYLEEEAKELRAALWQLLACRWIPGRPACVAAAQYKLHQLVRATELGLEIPPTLIPDGDEAIIAFYERHRGRIISKPLGPTAFAETVGTIFSRHTEPVTRRDLRAAVGAAALCPTIFQAYVEKQLELRITIVGERVFTAAIDSQRSNHTRTDWRKYDRDRQIYLPYQLPATVEKRCRLLMESLGLCYAAIDMILTPDGRYVFLELNPAGEYAFIEEQVDLPISSAIADLLVANDREPVHVAGKGGPCALSQTTVSRL
jgi:glutathione synthase/RimK-type ligase-like ATP-grasp enzyme